MCNDGLLDMTRGCDRRQTFQVHSATESRLKYKYREVLRLKNYSNVRSPIAAGDTNKAHRTICLPNDRGNHQDTYSVWCLSCLTNPPLQSILQTMNQAVRIFRASVPSGVACEYATSTTVTDIAGLSQVTGGHTLAARQSIFHLKN